MHTTLGGVLFISKYLKLKVSDLTYATLKEIANKKGYAMSHIVRVLVNKYTKSYRESEGVQR